MKASLPFLVCVTALAQSPPATPQNLRLAGTQLAASTVSLTTIAGTNNPLGIPHLGWAAYWQVPDNTNIWIPEYTIDGGATWTHCGNEWAGLGGDFGNWHYTETGTNWTYPRPIRMDEWLVRIRNLGPIRCPTCAYSPAVQLLSATAEKLRTPPLPPSSVSEAKLALQLNSMHQMTAAPILPLPDPGLVLHAASILDPNCDCRLFQVTFLAKTNHIYSFQRSRDFHNWEVRLPEIDGDPGINAFYDVFEDGAVYRIVSRKGVLPP